MDVLFSSSENTADVNWWSADNGDPTGSWTKHTILRMMERTHTLQAADMNLDGKMDVVLGQMHTSAANEIMIMFNLDGEGTTWDKQLVDTGGLHNGVVADIGNDGDYDIFGANWTGNPPVRLWENQLNASGSLDRWTYKQITDNNQQTFGLGFGDVDGDGRQDIVSGRYWYHNPGGDMLGDWTQHEFPNGLHAFMVLNVDGDNLADVMAQKDESGLAVYWLEATDETATDWTAVKVGTVESASHELGAQGYRTAVLSPGAPPVVAISSGNGIYYFQIPADPTAGDWPKVHVSSNPSDEGFAFGDINGDGQLDIAGTTGDSKRVEWYLNPGDGSGEWTAYPVGTFDEALYPDRTEVADLNGDGRLDVIVTEENGEDSDAQTFWWEQPADPTGGDWPRHLLTTQATTNSLDVADMNGDGSTDVVLAEHRGGLKLAIWVNDGQGNFTEQVVSTGKESHLGAQTVDLDGDGDLDIVSIAWDAPQFIHLWRNDELGHAASSAPQDAAPETPTPVPPDSSSSTAPQSEQDTAVAGPGPVALYIFDEGSGSRVHDVSGVGEPLDLVAADEAALAWLPSGGLQITAPTILASAGPAQKVIDAYKSSNELTVETWIKPADIEQDGPARIVTVSVDPFNRNMTLGQEFGAFDVRLRTTDTSENGVPSLSTPDGVAAPVLAHLVYTRDAAGQATIYRDGEVIAQGQVSGALSAWDEGFRLAIANEISLDRPWLGEYHQLALYDRALSADEAAAHFRAGPDGLPEPTPESAVAEAAPTREPQAAATAVSQAMPAPAETEAAVTAVPIVDAAQAPSPASTTPLVLIAGVLAVTVVVILVALTRRRKPSD
ncbi:MAG: VCBS repeat-containing protein, partial [Anaerolineales bacterium]|nr:VCBS repeat-containing protein [Anaerolineales bacterium]